MPQAKAFDTFHYFKADWCGPCGNTTPSVRDKKAETSHDINIWDVDDEDSGELVNRYQIRHVPALVMVSKNDGEIDDIERIMGAKNIVEVISDL